MPKDKKKVVKISKKKIDLPPQPSVVELEVSKPSIWFRSVQRHENVVSSHMWIINKEKIYENYGQSMNVWYDINGNEEYHPQGWEPKCSHVTLSHRVLLLPNGKVVTPIRQYCETKILPAGTFEALFYDFGSVDFNDVELCKPNVSSITTSKAQTVPRGSRINIEYTQTETSSVDIIASTNRAFALESINDETPTILNAFDVDDETTSNYKPIGGGNKIGRWINGRGNQITYDHDIGSWEKLTPEAIRKGLEIILDEGLDTSSAILYTSGEGIINLLNDPEIKDKGIFNIRSLEKYLGVKLIRTSVSPITGTKEVDVSESWWHKIKRVLWNKKPRGKTSIGGNGIRSTLFIPNIAFGLVTGRDLTMEAQRRNELQAIHITGTQRVSGIVKNIEACVRISHGKTPTDI